MKIKTQFIVSTVMLVIILLVVFVSAYVSYNLVQVTHIQQDLATQIERDAYELDYLANDYLLYRESQQARRWEAKFVTLSNHLSQVQAQLPEQQVLIDQLKSKQQRLQSVFAEISTFLETMPPSQRAEIAPTFLEVSWSRIELQNQGLIFDAYQLARSMREAEDQLQSQANLISFGLIAAFGVFLLTSYWATVRGILTAIAELHAGTRTIGLGQLDFVVPIKHKDEIGDLARAFNQMTADLKRVTASKTELEREIAERERVQTALRESNQKYTLLFDRSATAAALTKLPEGVFVDVNDAFVNLFGYTKPEVVGKTSLELGIARPAERAQTFVAIQQSGNVQNAEKHVMTKTGDERIVLTNINALTLEGQQYVITTIQDITEREQIEARLRANEAHLRSIYDTMIEGLANHAIIYQNGRAVDYCIIDINPAYEQITGLTRAQAVGKKASQLYGIGSPPYLEVYAAVAESGTPAYFETYFAPMHKHFAISVVAPQKGSFVTVFMDVTERKQAELALQRERDLLQAVMNGAKNSHLAYLDREFNFVRVNQAYADACHYRPEEMIGKNHFVLYPHAENARIFAAVRDTGEMVEYRDKPFEYPDQPERGVTYWDWTLTPVKQADGQVTGLILSLFETTAHKRMEDQLFATNQRLTALMNALPVGVSFSLDTTCQHVTGNPAALAQFEVQSEDNLSASALTDADAGRQVRYFRAGKPITDADLPLQRAVAENREIPPMELEVHLPSGRQWITSASGTPIRDQNGCVIGGVAVTLDITEQKRAEDALKASEHKYRTLFENITEEVHFWKLVRDQAGCIKTWRLVDVNPPTLKTWGRHSADEIRGLTTDEIFGPGATEHYMPVVQKIMTEGVPYSFEDYFPNLDKYFRFTSVPLGDHFITTGADISTIMRAQIALRASEERYRLLIETSPDAITLTDLQGNITMANRQMAIIHGYASTQEVIGLNAFHLIASEDQPRAFDNARKTLELGSIRDEEYTLIKKDGAHFPAELSAALIRDAAGNPEAFVGITKDITARKRAEERLRQLQSAVEQSPASIVITNAQGTIEYVNPKFIEITGYTFEDVRGKNPRVLKSGETPVDVYKQLWNTITAGEDWRGELLNKKKNGELHWESVSISPIMDTDTITHFVAVKQDITEHKRAEQALRRLNSELENQTAQVLRVNKELEYARRAALNVMEDALESRDALREARDQLEVRVQARTHELAESNDALRAEIVERKQAEDRATHSAMRAQALAHLSARLNAKLDLAAVLDAVCVGLTRALPVSAALVTLVDEKRGILYPAATNGLPIEFRAQMKPIACATWERLDSSEPVIVTAGMPLLGDLDNAQLYAAWDIRAGATVRLERKDKLIGTLSILTFGKPREWTRDELALLQGFAAQAALGIANARLYEDERRARRTAETLTSANLALTQTLNLDQVLKTLLDALSHLVPYDSANVMLLNNETWLEVYASRGYEQFTDPASVHALKFDTSTNRILQKMRATKASVLVTDARIEPDWEWKTGTDYVRSWLGIPLIAGGKMIGLYSLDHTLPQFFTEAHRELAEALAPQAAVAIQNAWLFQQVQTGRERLQDLSHRLVEVQENERRYIARELHDDVSQTLTSLMVGLKLIETAPNPATVTTRVADLKLIANDVFESLHRIATDLRPVSLEHLGLIATLDQHIANLNLKNDDMIQFETTGSDQVPLTPTLETALYRIAQEALNNALQHAHATHIDVQLEQGAQRIVLLVEDNGIGFEPAQALKSGRLGLVGLRERVEMLNGKLLIESSAGKGTTLRVEIPYGD